VKKFTERYAEGWKRSCFYDSSEFATEYAIGSLTEDSHGFATRYAVTRLPRRKNPIFTTGYAYGCLFVGGVTPENHSRVEEFAKIYEEEYRKSIEKGMSHEDSRAAAKMKAEGSKDGGDAAAASAGAADAPNGAAEPKAKGGEGTNNGEADDDDIIGDKVAGNPAAGAKGGENSEKKYKFSKQGVRCAKRWQCNGGRWQ
jgi:hypothetical protein